MSETEGMRFVDWPRAAGNPARRALELAGYTRLEQLAGTRSADLAKLHGVGPKALRVLAEALAARGLSFAEEE
ncbi:MAG: DNA-binding protein [Candidatus Promineofilum sp.]|nr:DNA-binding protein [Promineifilum sp.]